jgi:nicotinic acid mononucleotide adenylyltransferase
MKSFLDLIKEQEEDEKHHVITFGRMNPPTTGHLKLINKVKEIAKKHKASYEIIVSHSQDSKKNPLSSEQKVKHLTRYMASPKIEEAVSIKSSVHKIASKPKITAASKEKPTILHHAVASYKNGVTHLHVVVGSDRVKEMHDLLHKYNGVKAGHGEYHFKSIKIHSAGHRDPDAEGTEGMSGSKMREHAKNKDFKEFRKGVPSHVSDEHAKELMHDTRKGMGLHESHYHGMFKAVFVTGGPGSGKDVVIRESIPLSNAVEINSVQAFEYLADKHTLSQRTSDFRRESIRNRGPLIINGPADDIERISHIKEELEDLGYDTLMVFVNTTDEASKERNSRLKRMMSESIRHDKWIKSQENKDFFLERFSFFKEIDNNQTIQQIEEDITDTYQFINRFINDQFYSDIATDWFTRRNKSNIFEDKNVKSYSQFSKIKTSGNRAEGPSDIPADNRAGATDTGDDIRGNTFPRKNTNKTYTFKTYSEENNPKLTINPSPKETNFSKDKEKSRLKNKRFSDSPTQNQRMRNVTGIGPEFDTRQQGTVYPMSGLGDVTYREQKEIISFRKFREAIDDPGAVDMGVGGTLNGSTNKEPMQTYKDSDRNINIQIKKKKK